MEMNLQPLATSCFVSGDPFNEDDRIVSHLVRSESLEVMRYDVLESCVPEFQVEGRGVCTWIHPYKAKTEHENPERALKLTADNLFAALADPMNEPSEENTRLVQFLALMLERKRVLRPKGRNPEGDKHVYEHAKTKLLYEVPVGELDPAFFLAVQEQLSVLVGGPPEPKSVAVATETAE